MDIEGCQIIIFKNFVFFKTFSNVMKCNIMLHFICLYRLWVSRIQRVNVFSTIFTLLSKLGPWYISNIFFVLSDSVSAL